MNVHPAPSVTEIHLEVGAPVPLPAGPRAWAVSAGVVELHLYWPGGRRHLVTLDEGACAFGLGDGDISLRMVALEPTDLVDAADRPDLPEQADRWIAALGDAVGTVPPEQTKDVAGGQTMTVAAGDTVAGLRAPMWLEPQGAVALDLCDSGTMAIGGDVVAVSGALWARARGRGQIRPVPSQDLHDKGHLLEALADLTTDLVTVFERSADRADAAALQRMGLAADPVTGPASGGISAALGRVAAALGETIATPARETGDIGAVPALARAAGLRARKVVLDTEWMRTGTTPLIVRPAGQATVEALIWQRGAYRFEDGRAVRPGDCERIGFAISGPLPRTVVGIWSMARHVLRGNARDILDAGLAASGAALMGMLVPLATGWLLSDIVPAGMSGLLMSVGIALVMAALITAVLATARSFATTRIDGRTSVTLATGLIDRLLRLPTGFFHDFTAGDLNQRLENVEQIRQLAISVVMTAGLTVVLSVVYLAVLLVYDTRLALIALGLVSIYILAVIIARLLQIKAIREAAELDGQIAGLVFETLEAVPKLRSAAAEGRAMERWRTLYAKEREAAVRAGRVETHFGAFASTYQTITMLTLFAAAAVLVGQNLPAGVFIGFLAAFGAFQGAFVQFSEQLLRVYAAQPLIERAAPLLEAEPEFDAGRGDPGRLSGEIEGSALVFAYGPGLAPVLNGLDFHVRPGQHMAIVGASGSGKSTVLRLLLGFETQQRGSITYDGQDLSHLDLTRVRSQIGVVLQSSQLFAGSILDNIRGAGEASLEDCLEAAEKAGLARDLQYFAMGVHTPITEGATTLSGGQRQRILIARALAARPNILFFDEATSALDNATQAVVAETLDALAVTRVTIAHRLSTVRNADMICVLDGGVFAETGTYDELMAQGGRFARLAERQLTEG